MPDQTTDQTERLEKAPSIVSRQAALTALVQLLCQIQMERSDLGPMDRARMLSRLARMQAQQGLQDSGWYTPEQTSSGDNDD